MECYERCVVCPPSFHVDVDEIYCGIGLMKPNFWIMINILKPNSRYVFREIKGLTKFIVTLYTVEYATYETTAAKSIWCGD